MSGGRIAHNLREKLEYNIMGIMALYSCFMKQIKLNNLQIAPTSDFCQLPAVPVYIFKHSIIFTSVSDASSSKFIHSLETRIVLKQALGLYTFVVTFFSVIKQHNCKTAVDNHSSWLSW